jgi:hypothetical protein
MNRRCALMEGIHGATQWISCNVARELLLPVDIAQLQRERVGQLKHCSKRDEILPIGDVILELRFISPIGKPSFVEIIQRDGGPGCCMKLQAWADRIERGIPF